jgi:hypothetical protein
VARDPSNWSSEGIVAKLSIHFLIFGITLMMQAVLVEERREGGPSNLFLEFDFCFYIILLIFFFFVLF